MAALADLSVYIHVPFCSSKCRYCDFYSVTDVGCELYRKYTDVAIEDLKRNLDTLNPESIDTIFIGGGTPSLLPPDLLSIYLERIVSLTGKVQEFTIEANPESLTTETLHCLSESQVDRISMGVQTYDDDLLSWLGRPAGRETVNIADNNLSNLWEGRLSRDLLAALPQKGRNLIKDLDTAISGNPGHISLYELTVEEGTPLARDFQALELLPDSDESFDEWEKALIFLEHSGYERYEVSNFSINVQHCRHNLRYWEMKPYLGIGPGAASTIPSPDGRAIRREIRGNLSDWIESPVDQEINTIISREAFITEHLMMGLRTSFGLSLTNFKTVFGINITDLIPRTLEKWVTDEYLQLSGERLSPLSRGMDLLDSILEDIVGEMEIASEPSGYSWPALTVNKTA